MKEAKISKVDFIRGDGSVPVYVFQIQGDGVKAGDTRLNWDVHCSDLSNPAKWEIEDAELVINRAELFSGYKITNKPDAVKMLLKASVDSIDDSNYEVNVVRINFVRTGWESVYRVTFDKVVPKLGKNYDYAKTSVTHHESDNPSGRIIRTMREALNLMSAKSGYRIANFDFALKSLILATDR